MNIAITYGYAAVRYLLNGTEKLKTLRQGELKEIQYKLVERRLRNRRRVRCHFVPVIFFSAAGALLSSSTIAQQEQPSATVAAVHVVSPIRLQFFNADEADVLHAISMKTHANIVYSALVKRPITINMTAASVSEAVGFAAAAAGVTFREMNHRYFVAPAADLKSLIESFGVSEMIELNGFPSADALSLLAAATPYLTVRPAGAQLLVIGDPKDILLAGTILDRQARPAPAVNIVSEAATVRYTKVGPLAAMLKDLYPSLRAEALVVTDKDILGGTIGLIGSEADVASAKTILAKLDSSSLTSLSYLPVYKTYAVKFTGAKMLAAFLLKEIPGISAIVAPEHASPPAPAFNPLSGSLSSSGGSSGSPSTSSGSSGGASGSSSSSSGSGGATGQTQGAPDYDKATMIVLSGTDSQVTLALKLLEDVDIAPTQVMIEVKVLDVSPERAENLGVSWSWSPLGALEGAVGSPLTGGALTTPTVVPMSIGRIGRTPLGVQAVVSALSTSTDSKILATPRIQVLNNDDASIFIGDTLNVQVSQSSLSGSTVQVISFPVGIILLVRPRVSPDGQITMRVHPVVSTITGIGAGNLPQTSTREAETTVRVKDGETVVIGGLIRDEMSKIVSEIPLLSKLPLVGQLFRSTSKDHRKSEIMVFITPHIIK